MASALADYPASLTRRRLVLLYLLSALAALCLCDECVPWQDSDGCRFAFDTSFIRTRIFAVPFCRAALSFRLARQQRPVLAISWRPLWPYAFRSYFIRLGQPRALVRSNLCSAVMPVSIPPAAMRATSTTDRSANYQVTHESRYGVIALRCTGLRAWRMRSTAKVSFKSPRACVGHSSSSLCSMKTAFDLTRALFTSS